MSNCWMLPSQNFTFISSIILDYFRVWNSQVWWFNSLTLKWYKQFLWFLWFFVFLANSTMEKKIMWLIGLYTKAFVMIEKVKTMYEFVFLESYILPMSRWYHIGLVPTHLVEKWGISIETTWGGWTKVVTIVEILRFFFSLQKLTIIRCIWP